MCNKKKDNNMRVFSQLQLRPGLRKRLKITCCTIKEKILYNHLNQTYIYRKCWLNYYCKYTLKLSIIKISENKIQKYLKGFSFDLTLL